MRAFKAMQLLGMIGFARAGSEFAIHISDENISAFIVLAVDIAIGRFLLAVQYALALKFVHRDMKRVAKGVARWFNQTHVNARIKLLSMIILGEASMSLTRIVNRRGRGRLVRTRGLPHSGGSNHCRKAIVLQYPPLLQH
jgi:hypothetical protein